MKVQKIFLDTVIKVWAFINVASKPCQKAIKAYVIFVIPILLDA